MIKKGFKNKGHGKLAVSMVFGQKRGLPQKIKSPFKSLSLLHLFTPSGLHFTAFLLFLTPFLNRVQPLGWGRFNLKELIVTLICLLPFSLGGFFSLKRIAELRLLSAHVPRGTSFFLSFLLIFTVDFLWGSFHKSPLSFCYSFIFLGFLLAAGRFSIKLLLYLFTGQVLVAFFAGEKLFFFGPFFGMAITTLFTFFFPLLLMSLLLSSVIGFLPSEWLIQALLSTVKGAYSLASKGPLFEPSLTSLMILAWMISSFSHQIKRASFLALLSLYSFDLG